MKFNHKTESPEELLVKLQNLAMKIYPTPLDQPVAPLDYNVPNEHYRFIPKTTGNGNRRDFVLMEMEGHIIKLSKKDMAKLFRKKKS